LATHQKAIEVLSGGEAALSQFLPKDSSVAKSTGSASARENLKRLMLEVETLKREREELETRLKTVSFDLKTPFLNALAQDGAINEQAMSAELLGQALGPLDSQLKDSLAKQESIVAAVQQNSDEYFGRQSGTDTLSRRDQTMRQIAEGYDSFNELQSNISEGRKFYNDLTQLLIAFQSKISDFCFARKTEKEELLKDVTRDASNVSASQQAPPPRPPPPTVAAASTASTAPQYSSAPQPLPGAPPSYGQAQAGQPGGVPYPTGYPQAMPMPYQNQAAPYPVAPMAFTPMPAFNPYATYPPPSSNLKIHSYQFVWLNLQ
jgi:programmed cell death 6-interacting protein